MRACVRVWVGGWVGVCGCIGVCVSVYRRPNGWTDHDQIWHVYADRSGNGSYLKKIGPTYGSEGWAHWGHSSKRVLSWRAVSNPSSGSEPLAKLREEL